MAAEAAKAVNQQKEAARLAEESERLAAEAAAEAEHAAAHTAAVAAAAAEVCPSALLTSLALVYTAATREQSLMSSHGSRGYGCWYDAGGGSGGVGAVPTVCCAPGPHDGRSSQQLLAHGGGTASAGHTADG